MVRTLLLIGALLPTALALCSNGTGLVDGRTRCDDPYCAVCTDHATVCTRCMYTYGFDANVGGRCSRCWDQMCHDCGANSSTCVSCFTGYGFDSATGACTPAPPGCLSSRDGRCTSCLSGHGIDSALGTCVACADPHCFNCSADPFVCTACSGTMALLNGRCTDACHQYCESCDKGTCKQCEQGWMLTLDGGCEPVRCGDGCVKCEGDSACRRCAPFYELVDHQCSPCQLQWACSGDVGTTVWQASTCFHGNFAVPIQLVPENNTVCGACSALAPVPLLPNNLYVEAVERVATILGLPAESLAPIGMCGNVQRRGAWENSTYDVRALGNGVLLRGLYRVERISQPNGDKTTVLGAWKLLL